MSVENFLEKFGVEDDGSLLSLIYLRAIVAIGDSTKRGDCWVCCASHMPLNHRMDACHRSPICRFKACCNPEHLYWDTHKNNCERREAEKRRRQAAKVLVSQMMGGSKALSSSGKDLPS
jgi:hypothetical protein